MAFDGSNLEIMTKSRDHEKYRRLLGYAVFEIAKVLDRPLGSYGEMTWKRPAIGRGIEADQCYYVELQKIEAAAKIKGKNAARRMPPPDLAIEIDISPPEIDWPGIYAALLALRTVAILLVVFLLFRPVLSLEREQLQRRAVILALDTSSSMSTADDATGTTRFEQARTRVLDWSSKLKKDFDLQVLEFSERATPLDRPGDLARLEPTGEATSLSRALVAGARVVPRRAVEAVVLFSDGIHNAAGDPVAAARKLGVVVHAIGVGNSLRNSPSYRDVRVATSSAPSSCP